MDNLDDIVKYENGELSDEETIALFQNMIDSGMVWELQGFYGRMAVNLINEGLCHKAIQKQGE